jgi:hypothetical protein
MLTFLRPRERYALVAETVSSRIWIAVGVSKESQSATRNAYCAS